MKQPDFLKDRWEPDPPRRWDETHLGAAWVAWQKVNQATFAPTLSVQWRQPEFSATYTVTLTAHYNGYRTECSATWGALSQRPLDHVFDLLLVKCLNSLAGYDTSGSEAG